MGTPYLLSPDGVWIWGFALALVLGILIGIAALKKKPNYRQPYSSAKRPGEPLSPDDVQGEVRRRSKIG